MDLARAARYRVIAGPVSMRTRIIRRYPLIHTLANNDDWPAYGLASPGSASEPSYSARVAFIRIVTRTRQA